MKQLESAQDLGERIESLYEQAYAAFRSSNNYIRLALVGAVAGRLLSPVVNDMAAYMGTLLNPLINTEFLKGTNSVWVAAIASFTFLGISIVDSYRSISFIDKIAALSDRIAPRIRQSPGYRADGGS